MQIKYQYQYQLFIYVYTACDDCDVSQAVG